MSVVGTNEMDVRVVGTRETDMVVSVVGTREIDMLVTVVVKSVKTGDGEIETEVSVQAVSVIDSVQAVSVRVSNCVSVTVTGGRSSEMPNFRHQLLRMPSSAGHSSKMSSRQFPSADSVLKLFSDSKALNIVPSHVWLHVDEPIK